MEKKKSSKKSGVATLRRQARKAWLDCIEMYVVDVLRGNPVKLKKAQARQGARSIMKIVRAQCAPRSF